MKILIIANFTRDFSQNDNGRFMYLAKGLAANGHRVEIVTTAFSRNKSGRKPPVTEDYPFKITMLPEPGYTKHVSLRRLYSHRVWGEHLKEYLETIEKPDVIYCAVPSLTGPGHAAAYCEKNGVRFVIDIQDLWPEAFQMAFNVPVVSALAFLPFRRKANAVYRRADGICAVSKTYVDRALRVNRKCPSGTTVFLGTDLAVFDGYAGGEPLLSKEPGELWLAYCGTLGDSYDLTCVIDALALLEERGISLRFIVMGAGPRREEFRRRAEEKGVDAVFTGKLPYDQMCALLCACDITVNPIAHLAAQSIINKHADYAASGLPVVSTQENSEYRALVEEYEMGFNCKNNDAADLAEKLTRLALDPALRLEMGKNARRCAEERFDRAHAYRALEKAILGEG